MEKLEVFYKPYGYLGYHKYFVYTQADGARLAYRCGPDPSQNEPDKKQAVLELEQGKNPYAPLRSQTGNYQPGWMDYPPSGTFHNSEVITKAADLSELWKRLVQEMEHFNQVDYQYHPTLQSSNTVTDAILTKLELPLPTLDGWGKWWAPGSRRELKPGKVEGVALSTTVPQEYLNQLCDRALATLNQKL